MSTKILITSEIATGVVNGTNKIFNTSKLISSISSIIVNGVEYAQYTYGGTTITLDDSPSTGQVLVTYSYESNYDFLDNNGWIVGEVMSGTVGGGNRVFSSYYPISSVDEVRVNGVVVSGYTINGNNILLQVAPTVGYVEIDYFRKDLIVQDFNKDNYKTKKDLRDLVYLEIGQDETSTQYPKALVDSAISDGVDELITHMVDKSRNTIFTIKNQNPIRVSKIVNSINTFSITKELPIPPSGRLMSTIDGSSINYSNVTSSNIISSISYDKIPDVLELYYVGYRLPRNIKRVVGVRYGKFGGLSQEAGSINDFIFGYPSYVINNGYIYLKHNDTYTIEVELNEYANIDDDNSLIFIDKDDTGVIVYYALRQLYQSRESDKLEITSQLFQDKMKAYKRRMAKKRANNKQNIIKTINGLTPR